MATADRGDSETVLTDLELTRGLTIQMTAIGTLGMVVGWAVFSTLYPATIGVVGEEVASQVGLLVVLWAVVGVLVWRYGTDRLASKPLPDGGLDFVACDESRNSGHSSGHACGGSSSANSSSSASTTIWSEASPSHTRGPTVRNSERNGLLNSEGVVSMMVRTVDASLDRPPHVLVIR